VVRQGGGRVLTLMPEFAPGVSVIALPLMS
jgi:hypothetical protein